MRAGRYKYAASRGEAELLNSLSAQYTRSTGRPISTRQFIFLPGTQTALFVAMLATIELGDEVLMADPYYATYEGVIAAAGGIPVPIAVDPDHGFHLKAADLERAITPKTPCPSAQYPKQPHRGRAHPARPLPKSATSASATTCGSSPMKSMPP
jgi:arginine:pyruvate transaminase